MSVARAQREIDSAEFAEWQAFDQVEPFGERRADLRAGIIAATVANVNRHRTAPAFTPATFMPTFDGPHQQSPDEIQARLESRLSTLSTR